MIKIKKLIHSLNNNKNNNEKKLSKLKKYLNKIKYIKKVYMNKCKNN